MYWWRTALQQAHFHAVPGAAHAHQNAVVQGLQEALRQAQLQEAAAKAAPTSWGERSRQAL